MEFDLDAFIAATLAEDLGEGGDITSAAVIPSEARFEGVDYDTSLTINGKHPWRLMAQWQHPATKKVYSFRSDPIWFDPSPYVNRETLDVMVNADDPSQYQIDMSFLPKSG